MKKKAIAVFISGRGSNLKSIINACNDIDFPGFVSIVISDNKNALGLEYAKKDNISYKVFEILSFLAYSSPKAFLLSEITMETKPGKSISLQALIIDFKFEPLPEIKTAIAFFFI
jgi:hypothetical protein